MSSISILQKYLTHRKNSKWLILLSIGSALFGGASTAGLIALFHKVIKSQTVDKYVWLSFFALWLGHGIFNFLSSFSITKLSQRTVYDLRVNLTRRILATKLEVLEKIGKSKLLEHLSQIIKIISSNVETLPSFLTKLVTIVALLAYLIWISPKLFVAFLLFSILGVFLYLLPMVAYQKYVKQRIEAESDVNKQLHSLTEGVKELLLSRNRKSKFLDFHFRPSLQKVMDAVIKSRFIDYSLRRWGELYSFLGAALMLFLLPEWDYVSYREILDFMIVLLFAIEPLTTVVNFFYFNIQDMNVAFRQLDNLGLQLVSDEAESQRPLATAYKPNDFSLEFRDISFRYYNQEKDEEFELGPLSFEATRREILFITGGNGSGKSTLAKIICGLYTPEGGSIVYNGEVVSGENRESYRQLFSVVFFDFYLFDTLLGLEDVEVDEQANRYLHELHLAQKLSIHKGELSTSKLSQGQRKRLALLNALMEDRPFYIFDEWAADQDPQFKAIFYKEILPGLKAKGKMVFVITHDDTYFDTADRIIHLVDGQMRLS